MTDSKFGELVTQYQRLVYTICYQLVQEHHTAEDLLQETFLAAYRHKETCPTDDGFKPWIARIATNKAKDYLKSAYNRRVQTEDEHGLPEGKGSKVLFMHPSQPEDITIENEAVRQITNEIKNLKEPYLQVSVLYFLEERTVDEIAQILCRPPKTVHTQLYRAKQMLQKQWKGASK